MRQVDTFYNQLKEPNKSCLEAMRRIILQFDPTITEALKYGMPFFCYKNKMLCYLWTNKETRLPYLGFVDGNLLELDWLEAGQRARMKIMTVDPYEDLPVKKIRQTLKLAIALRN